MSQRRSRADEPKERGLKREREGEEKKKNEPPLSTSSAQPPERAMDQQPAWAFPKIPL